MAATMTASQRRTGAISNFAGRAAWVHLAARFCRSFGAVVLSLVLGWVGLYTVALREDLPDLLGRAPISPRPRSTPPTGCGT
jgi:hypothetical protein